MNDYQLPLPDLTGIVRTFPRRYSNKSSMDHAELLVNIRRARAAMAPRIGWESCPK